MGARLQRGWLLHEQGRYELAEREAEAALAEDPEDADAWCLVAFARMRAGRNGEAQDAARRRYAVYRQLAGITVPLPETTDDSAPAAALEAKV